MYKSILRPWLFRMDAEKIHGQIVALLHVYRHFPPVKCLLRAFYRPKATPFQWRNLTFANRVGLSAGFDKEANCFDELSDLGFGFLEVGTVTPEKVAGNPFPRIFRLPEDHALVSRTCRPALSRRIAWSRPHQAVHELRWRSCRVPSWRSFRMADVARV